MKQLLVDRIDIHTSMVEYVQARRNYTIIHLADGRWVISSKNLGKVVSFLGLVVVRRGVAVNPAYVSVFVGGQVETFSGYTVEVSRRLRHTIDNKLS